MYCYKFPNEEAWLTAAAAEGLIVEDQLQAYTHTHAIDVVGTIFTPGTYWPSRLPDSTLQELTQ